MDARSKRARVLRLRAYIAAIPKRLGGVPLTIGSKDYTLNELGQVFQEELDAILALDAASAAKEKAVLAERTVKARNRALHRTFKRFLQAVFNDDVTLADFLLKPVEGPRTKLETKVVAIQKAKATREARHTLGKKQKKKIRG